jgi:PKD repeat protein
MSYDDCQNMFSVGQVDLMVSTMSQFSRLVTLVSQDNLDNTGVGLLYEADFESDKNVVCVGSEVNYKDMSFYGQRLWSWTLPGAQPENPNDKNPSVVYNTPGVHNARLSVSNGTEIRNKNKDNFVLVSPERGYWNDFEQDFEDGVFPSSKWLAVDETGDDISWEMVNTAASSGTNSIMLENYNAVEGSRDLLYTSTYDLSPFQSVELKLNYAFARKTSQDSERMLVAYSNDCGETWTNFWNVGSGNLATTGNQPNSAFVPVAAEWKTESQTLTTPMLSESIQFRFTFFGDGGNNIYIDDFDMEVVWKDQPTLQSPASGETVNSFAVTLDWKTLPNADQYEYELASDNSFSNVIKTGTLNAIDINPDNADSEILAEGLDRGGLYFWRVRAIET